jgi:hypothetical protein
MEIEFQAIWEAICSIMQTTLYIYMKLLSFYVTS